MRCVLALIDLAMERFRLSSLSPVLVTLGILLAPTAHAEQKFADVPPEHPVFEAVQYLSENNVVGGYDDGTYKPDKKVNRAEAIKLIIAQIVDQATLDKQNEVVYEDVPEDAWFRPFVEVARKRNIVDGPPKKKKFKGGNPVLKAEFLKMMLLANKINPNDYFSELNLPLATDVSNPDEWFYQYMKYAVVSSMIMIGTDGSLHPGDQLTRGDVALLLHRFAMYNEGRRTQALLAEAESEIIVTLNMLDDNNITQA